LNNDNYLDIIVVNNNQNNIGVFLGYGNGNFQEQKTSFTGGFIQRVYVSVGDFNEDSFLDVVVSYTLKYSVGIMFGYGNGSFDEPIRFLADTYWTLYQTVVIDFNGDDHLDIVMLQTDYLIVNILFGDGKGNFQQQTVLTTNIEVGNTWIRAGDFNNDRYQDIITLCSSSDTLNILFNECGCCTT
jgi:hypothetical protein